MSTSSTKAPPTAAERVRRVARTVTRLLLIGAILWAGWTIVGAWSLMLGDATPAKRLPAEVQEYEGALPVELLASMPPGGSWQFPVALKAGEKVPAPLLPLEEGVKRLCLQRDETGVIHAEILSTSLAAKDLAAHWQAAGWQVRWGKNSTDGSMSLVCSKESETVRVWTTPLNEATKERTVFLVRGEAQGK
jgi:hypothetical protein